MKPLILFLLSTLLALNAQPPSVPPAKPTVFNGNGVPTSVPNAQFGDQYVDLITGNVYTCVNTAGCSGSIYTWTAGGGGGSGSVTEVDTGNGLTGGPITGTGTVSATTALINDSIAYCADAGSTDAYACSLSPAPVAYVAGARYRFKANTANTGAATVNFNSLGATAIKKAAGGVTTALADNDIRSGQVVDLVYDGTNMQMQSLLGNAPPSAGTGDPGSLVPVSFSATPTFTCNANTSTTFTLTLTGSVSSSTFASCSTGQRVSLIICQDSTGSRTFVGPTNLQNFPTIASTAHYCTAASGTYDGTNLVVGVANVFKDDYTLIGSQLPLNGSTSGTTILKPAATASGTLTLPAATDTLIGKATTDTLTNKTFDTAGTGNSFKVGGTSITALSGTGGTLCTSVGSACGGTGGTMFSTAGIGNWWPFGFPNAAGAAGLNGAPAAHRVVYREFAAPAGMTVRSLTWFQQADDSGKHYTWGIYDSTKALVTNAQCATVTSAANTIQSCAMAGDVALTAGTYYLAYTTDSTSNNLTVYATADSQIASQVLGSLAAPRIFYGSTASTGTTTLALPSSFGGDSLTARSFEQFPHVVFLP